MMTSSGLLSETNDDIIGLLSQTWQSFSKATETQAQTALPAPFIGMRIISGLYKGRNF